MSVLAFILEPVNDYEKKFAIPLATEIFFIDYWIPAISELELKWSAHFSTGIDITCDDLPQVISELRLIKEWGIQHLAEDNRKHMTDRIELLIRKLPEAFQREGTVVFIG
ncbi:hypothetical protein OB236_08200 [Paenibacillus sp. WQ 127069]|uniref:Uncharacterized protein n=1 Tax=Paenibacillus baimaensis TaxID=2982185 RepID=A0ABT2UBW1_9BACL|nr:hypothetical protein [Paenibacillus sp. WQ 127069]MCU6792106.1 hypothetical protein [Paenibacillus sp. WQ 127069]